MSKTKSLVFLVLATACLLYTSGWPVKNIFLRRPRPSRIPKPNEVMVKYNRTIIIIEPPEAATKSADQKPPEKADDNPENYFVKTFAPALTKTANKIIFRMCSSNDTITYRNCCEDLDRLKKKLQVTKEQKKSKVQGFCHENTTRQHPCPKPLVCPKHGPRPPAGTVTIPKKEINICSKCSACEFQTDENGGGVLMRCLECRPVNNHPGVAGRTVVKIRSKFLQVGNRTSGNCSSLRFMLRDKGVQLPQANS